MTWPDLHVVLEGKKTLGRFEQSVGGRLAGTHDTSSRLQQVRTSEIADKNEITGRDTDRLGSPSSEIRYEEAHVLGGVSRRVQCLDSDMTDGEDIVVLEKMDVVVTGLGPIVLPFRVALVGQEEFYTILLAELASPREEVGVDVGFSHCHDAEIFLRRNRYVSIDVPLGVDHEGLARLLTTDEVGVLGKRRVENLAKKHVCVLTAPVVLAVR